MSGGDRGRERATSTYLYGFNGMAFGMDFNILWVGSTISAQDLCRLYYNVQQEIIACCYTCTNSDHNQTFSRYCNALAAGLPNLYPILPSMRQ